MVVLLEESASFRERVGSFRSDPGIFLADVTTFVPPRRSAVLRPVRFPAAVPPGSTAQLRLRLAKLGGGFNRLAGHPEAFGHLPTLAAQLLP